MITYGNIYIITNNFEEAITFYKQLFERDVTAQNKTRYASFEMPGLTLALLNGHFDIEHPNEVERRDEYVEIYDNTDRILQATNCGKVVINLNTDDLKKEWERIKRAGIGSDLTPIRYLNAKMPYWYFLLKDPDGNTIEIAGPVKEQQ